MAVHPIILLVTVGALVSIAALVWIKDHRPRLYARLEKAFDYSAIGFCVLILLGLLASLVETTIGGNFTPLLTVVGIVSFLVLLGTLPGVACTALAVAGFVGCLAWLMVESPLDTYEPGVVVFLLLFVGFWILKIAVVVAAALAYASLFFHNSLPGSWQWFAMLIPAVLWWLGGDIALLLTFLAYLMAGLSYALYRAVQDGESSILDESSP
jgi:hypothetical protein